MAALVAIRFNPVIKDFYQPLLDQGKLKKVEGLSLEFISRACKPRFDCLYAQAADFA